MSKISRVAAINAIEGEFAMEYQVESERGFHALGTTYFSPSMRLPFDPAHFTDPQGVPLGERLTDFQPPDGSWVWVWSRWYVDMGSDVDDQGWRYSWHFSSKSWSGQHRFARSFVRQRLWKRPRIKREVLEQHEIRSRRTGKMSASYLQETLGVAPDMPLELLLNPNTDGSASEWVKKVEKNDDEVLPEKPLLEKAADKLGLTDHDADEVFPLPEAGHTDNTSDPNDTEPLVDTDHVKNADSAKKNTHKLNDADHLNYTDDPHSLASHKVTHAGMRIELDSPITPISSPGSTRMGFIASPEVLAKTNFSDIDDDSDSFHTVASIDAPENNTTAITLLNKLADLRNDRERMGYLYDFIISHPEYLDLLVSLRGQIMSSFRFPVSRKTLLAKLTQSGNTTAENFALLPNSSWRDQVLLHGEPQRDDKQEDAE